MIKTHPITIFFLLRSWWFVFTAPIIRILLEYIISKQAQRILLSEVVLLVVAVLMSVIGWKSICILAMKDILTINKGVLLKRSVSIKIDNLLSISTKQNLFYFVIGCLRCRFCTSFTNDKDCRLNLKTKDFYKVLNKKNINTSFLPIKRQKDLKRYLFVPFLLISAIILVILIRTSFFGLVKKYEIVFFTALGIGAIVYAWFCYYDYKRGELCLGEQLFVAAKELFGFKTIYCSKKAVEIIKLSQTPADRRYKTCKVKIKPMGAHGNGARIIHMEYKSVIEQIEETFK